VGIALIAAPSLHLVANAMLGGQGEHRESYDERLLSAARRLGIETQPL